MKIIDLLKHFLKVGEIHARINNKQIKINGVPITKEDLHNTIHVMSGYWEYGDFCWNWCIQLKPAERTTFNAFNVRDFFGAEPTNIKMYRFLTGFDLITLSKKEEYVFMIDDGEGTHPARP